MCLYYVLRLSVCAGALV